MNELDDTYIEVVEKVYGSWCWHIYFDV